MANQVASFLNPAQLHHRWGFHTESIRRMVRQGRLPAVRIGKRLLVAQSDIEAFEQQHRVQPNTAGAL